MFRFESAPTLPLIFALIGAAIVGISLATASAASGAEKDPKPTSITVRYLDNGLGSAVTITPGKDVVVSQSTVAAKGTFTLSAADPSKGLKSNTLFSLNGYEIAVHTSCSQPLPLGGIWDDDSGRLAASSRASYSPGGSSAAVELVSVTPPNACGTVATTSTTSTPTTTSTTATTTSTPTTATTTVTTATTATVTTGTTATVTTGSTATVTTGSTATTTATVTTGSTATVTTGSTATTTATVTSPTTQTVTTGATVAVTTGTTATVTAATTATTAITLTVCPNGAMPVNGACPTPVPTPCPDGSMPVGGVCATPAGSVGGATSPPQTPCPNGQMPINGACPQPTPCPDGSMPINGACPQPTPAGSVLAATNPPGATLPPTDAADIIPAATRSAGSLAAMLIVFSVGVFLAMLIAMPESRRRRNPGA